VPPTPRRLCNGYGGLGENGKRAFPAAQGKHQRRPG